MAFWREKRRVCSTSKTLIFVEKNI